MTLRVLVVDDEPLGRERLRTLLGAEPDCQLVACCGSGNEALELLRAEPVDVVFLDIEMPGLDGFGLLDALPAGGRPHVVCVTAHESHAIRAFGVRALDYLLKPGTITVPAAFTASTGIEIWIGFVATSH